MEKIKKIGKKMISRKSYEDFLVAFLRPLVLLVLRPKYALRQTGQFLKPRNLMAWVLATRTRKVTASLLVAILVIAPLYGIIFRKETEAAWWNDMWKYRKKLTINKSQVAGELQNFPMLVSLTDTDLSTNAQSDGDDIVFTDAMGHKLSHEIESYSSGTLVAWVKIPNLSPAHNQDIYLYYGNSTCQTQQQPTEVWDDNFKMVQHMNQDPSGTAPQMLDSSENNNDGTSGGTMTNGDLVDAKIGKGLDFDGTDDFVNMNSSASLEISDTITVSLWMKANTGSQVDTYNRPISKGGTAGWELQRENSSSNTILRVDTSGGTNQEAASISNVFDDQWHLITFTLNSGRVMTYKDGVLSGSDTYVHGNGFSNTNPLQIAKRNTAASNYMNGQIDNVFISNSIRSSQWIQTEYNNQNNPSTFLSVNNQQQERPGSPIGYWPLNEGYGTTTHDQSGGNNTGTITGATWAGESECVSGACLRFDGSGDEVDAGDVNY